MPGQVAVSLMWGWTSFAAGLALCWGALLRPGEFLAAIRKDLLLPTDVSSAVPYALLAIKDPKNAVYTFPSSDGKVGHTGSP